MKNFNFKDVNFKKAMAIVVLAVFIGTCLGSMTYGIMRNTANKEVVDMFKNDFEVYEYNDSSPFKIIVRGRDYDNRTYKDVTVHWYFISDVSTATFYD